MSAEEKKENEETPKSAEGGDVAPEATLEQKLREELLYARADFENSKRRLLREQENSIRFANEKIIGELLTVVDLFDRALISAKPLEQSGEESAKGVLAGIQMTHRELANVLGRFGVEFIGTIGEKFDPNRHEAVSQSPSSEEMEDHVTEVVQRGCLYQGRLLKPAKVIVGLGKNS